MQKRVTLFVATVLLLCCSCALSHKDMKIEEMKDTDLEHALAERRMTLDDFIHRYNLDSSQSQLLPAGSVEENMYDFPVGDRDLLIAVNESNIVTRAFFAERHTHESPTNRNIITNRVVKPY